MNIMSNLMGALKKLNGAVGLHMTQPTTEPDDLPGNNTKHGRQNLTHADRQIARLEAEARDMRRTLDLLREERDLVQGRGEEADDEYNVNA